MADVRNGRSTSLADVAVVPVGGERGSSGAALQSLQPLFSLRCNSRSNFGGAFDFHFECHFMQGAGVASTRRLYCVTAPENTIRPVEIDTAEWLFARECFETSCHSS